MDHNSFSISTFDLSDTALDDTDVRIVEELQRNARITFAELGRRISLTSPAVTERVRRLERIGVIQGYHATVDPAALGRPILAYIRVSADTHPRRAKLAERLDQLPQVMEAHALTGEDCYLAKVNVGTMGELDSLTTSLALFGKTSTSVVLSSPVDRPGLVAGI